MGHNVIDPEPSSIDKNQEFWTYKINKENNADNRFKINKILTSKYTRYSFFPKNLFE